MRTECANWSQSKSVMNLFRMQLRRSCLTSDPAGHGLYPIQLSRMKILPICGSFPPILSAEFSSSLALDFGLGLHWLRDIRGIRGFLYFSVITRHSAALSLYNMPPVIFTSRLEL